MRTFHISGDNNAHTHVRCDSIEEAIVIARERGMQNISRVEEIEIEFN